MLHDADGWKTYTPTANFKPEDEIGYRGEKLFEQPLISLQPGMRAVPEVHFSWFDPTTRRYEQAHTEPLTMAITPAPAGSPPASGPVSASSGDASNPAATQAGPSWRPDHPDDGSGRTGTLMPHFFQPAYLALPPLVLIALSTAWFWLRREEQQAQAVRVEPFMLPSVESLGTEMDEYAAAGDVQSFFGTARRALCAVLASKWRLTLPEVTTEEVVSRLGADNEIARTLLLADEAAYSNLKLTPLDFRQCKRIVLRNLDGGTPP